MDSRLECGRDRSPDHPLSRLAIYGGEALVFGIEIGFHRLSFLKARKKQPDCAFKLVFKVPDVARKRRALQRMGVSMTKIWRLEHGSICDGWDPEGHRFQIADR